MGAQNTADAIEQVLRAEREASAQVERCREEAESRIHQGLIESRAILDRADRRISRVHAVTDGAIQGEVARIRAEMAALSAAPEVDDAEQQAMAWAVDRLALDLTGALTGGAP